MIKRSLEEMQAQHARLTDELLYCAPNTERAKELRNMILTLERSIQTPPKKMNPLELRRAEEMAARLHLPATEDEPTT